MTISKTQIEAREHESPLKCTLDGRKGVKTQGQVSWPNQSSNSILQFMRLVNPGVKPSKPPALLIALITEAKDSNDQSSKQRQKVPAQHGDGSRMQETRMP